MEINLEKIELVKDRTGATYAEAKEALEKAEGSVVDAIIDIEEKQNKEFDAVNGGSIKDSPVFARMKEIIEKGNVTKIVIRKGEKTIVNFPVTAGVIGAVLVPWGAVFGVVAALGTQCEIELYDQDGNIIDFNGKLTGAYEQAKDAARKGVDKAFGKAGIDDSDIEKAGDKIEDFAYKTSDKLQELGDKGAAKFEEAWNKLGESGTADDIREAFVTGTAKLMTLWDRLEKSGKISDVRDTVEKVAKKAAETAKGIAKEASDRIDRDDAEEKEPESDFGEEFSEADKDEFI